MAMRAKLVAVKIDRKRVLKKASPILKAEVYNLAAKFTETISSPIFTWDGKAYTLRRDGSYVASPRNIFDKGDFSRSLKIVKISESEYQIVWGVPYAKTILYGNSYFSGRDWITATMNTYPMIHFKQARGFVLKKND